MNINSTFAHSPCASPTGIDKLSLTTRDFRITDGSRSGLTVQDAPRQIGTDENNNVLLFRDAAGQDITGMKAFRNEELFSININQNGLNVVLNPSKPYHKYELCRNEETLSERTETVFKRLKALGIKTDYEAMKVTRIDLARNGEMKLPCFSYQPVFSGLGIPRTKRAASYPDGYSNNNNTFGLTFYNKGKEAEIENVDNLLRAELQFKKAKGTNFKGLQIYSVKDIAAVGFGHLNDVYADIMQKHVFKTDTFTGQARITFADSIEELKAIQQQYGKQQALVIFEGIRGIEPLLNDFGGIEGYRQFLKSYGCHRNTVAKRIRTVQKSLAFISQMHKSKSIGKLYRELWQTFAA